MQGKVSSEPGAFQTYVGIDVCKDRLDVYFHPTGQRLQIGNDPVGVRKLKRALAAYADVLVVMEATGKFHRAVHRSLHADGFAVAVVNPMRARLFAKALGVLAKTDSLDCKVLAIFGQSVAPDAKPPAEARVEEVQEIVRCRDGAVATCTGLHNQLGAACARSAKTEIKRQIRAAETAVKNLTLAVERLIASDPALARRLAVLTSIPGVGKLTAVALIANLGEIGSLSAKQTAMIAGLAPVACDSGERNGPRHIAGGRARLRRALYMAAVAAARFNPPLKIFYDRLIGEGKKAKVALTAVMRKLVVLANALVAQDRLWQPVQP